VHQLIYKTKNQAIIKRLLFRLSSRLKLTKVLALVLKMIFIAMLTALRRPHAHKEAAKAARSALGEQIAGPRRSYRPVS
jgi:branched-subunit amino acid transport protein